MIGSGAVGASTAWYLAKHGHKVVIIDPLLKKQPTNSQLPLNGTTASLGVLMGYVFRKSSGRGWRMRKRSMELWQEWSTLLNTPETPFALNKPLMQLASSEKEAFIMEKLINERQGLGLEIFPISPEKKLDRLLPTHKYGGLISTQDGRINPLQLQKCLLGALEKLNVQIICKRVIEIKRGSSTKPRQWYLHLSNKKKIAKEIIIICAPLSSEALLKPLGYNVPITPILGQVIDLKLKSDQKNWSGWPAVLSHEGINLIPYNQNRLLMGATLEIGTVASKEKLEQMKSMNGTAPDWLKEAEIINHWSGLRGRPLNCPAPILKNLEPGLIIATGHYRNGILLAPASAEWVVNEVNKIHN
ncbi:FAD-dependent oxidoreductase [Prochlorococcus sp. MIT 1307]|uniref:NAD(P)/FAD-dependent oxidoreductase n=1 Tax=Prochlorococcus sp. MIT 1307 TaxID=3096219 RepID=UPI002A765ED7|nr:FAD-dependent oxidoreductase [Prochlorococcus sp. MIT 1307]